MNSYRRFWLGTSWKMNGSKAMAEGYEEALARCDWSQFRQHRAVRSAAVSVRANRRDSSHGNASARWRSERALERGRSVHR